MFNPKSLQSVTIVLLWYFTIKTNNNRFVLQHVLYKCCFCSTWKSQTKKRGQFTRQTRTFGNLECWCGPCRGTVETRTGRPRPQRQSRPPWPPTANRNQVMQEFRMRNWWRCQAQEAADYCGEKRRNHQKTIGKKTKPSNLTSNLTSLEALVKLLIIVF